MSTFEKLLPREKIEPRERTDYVINPNDAIKLIVRDISNDPKIQDPSTSLGKKYKLAQDLAKETQVIDINEKSPRKTPKKKSKKNHS